VPSGKINGIGAIPLLHSQAFGNISTLQARSSARWSNTLLYTNLTTIEIICNNTCGRSAMSASTYDSQIWALLEIVSSQSASRVMGCWRRLWRPCFVPWCHRLGISRASVYAWCSIKHPIIYTVQVYGRYRVRNVIRSDRAQVVTIPITRSMSMLRRGLHLPQGICNTNDQTAHPTQPRAEDMAQ
jgi:hypothetical protein